MELQLIFKIGFLNAWILMSVFIWQMLIIMFARDSVRQRSHVPQEAKRSTLEKYIGIIGNVVWFIALVYSIFLPLKTGTIWFYMGLIFFIIGLLYLVIATINFIKTPTNQVISTGIYTISRHPMYLATILICLGSGFASGSLVFIFLTLIMAICFHKEALLEEKYCLLHYGNEYQQYVNSTPRWIGIPKRKLDS